MLHILNKLRNIKEEKRGVLMRDVHLPQDKVYVHDMHAAKVKERSRGYEIRHYLITLAISNHLISTSFLNTKSLFSKEKHCLHTQPTELYRQGFITT